MIQLREDTEVVASTVAGRVEHLSSGVSTMFDSVDELIAWMGDAIARDAARMTK